jgi:hypothetical protein
MPLPRRFWWMQRITWSATLPWKLCLHGASHSSRIAGSNGSAMLVTYRAWVHKPIWHGWSQPIEGTHPKPKMVEIWIWLVVWNMAFIFHNIWDVILPIDFHMFQRDACRDLSSPRIPSRSLSIERSVSSPCGTMVPRTQLPFFPSPKELKTRRGGHFQASWIFPEYSKTRQCQPWINKPQTAVWRVLPQLINHGLLIRGWD